MFSCHALSSSFRLKTFNLKHLIILIKRLSVGTYAKENIKLNKKALFKNSMELSKIFPIVKRTSTFLPILFLSQDFQEKALVEDEIRRALRGGTDVEKRVTHFVPFFINLHSNFFIIYIAIIQSERLYFYELFESILNARLNVSH